MASSTTESPRLRRASRRFLAGSASFLALLLAPLPGHAQEASETGRIVGKVLNAENAKPLSGAQVTLQGTNQGALTDLNGRYVLTNVPAGTRTVSVQMLGYGQKSVSEVQVTPNQTTSLDITLEETAVEVEGITVSATRERGSNAFLLDQRRTSSAVVEAVGAQEISRRPDSDAAQVAKRMTGVTVTEGKYVFVRGLGERYSQTTLNGSSLPSPEPEKEVVPLDLFPSGFLESLETQKTYTPDLPADFSGGSVKIQTKDFPDQFTVRLGVSSSFNSASQFQDNFLSGQRGDLDWLGFDDGTRELPDEAKEVLGDIESGGRLPGDDEAVVRVGRSLAQDDLQFAPGTGDTPLNRSFNGSIGGRTEVLDDGELGYFVAGTYGDTYQIRPDETERKWRADSFDPALEDRVPNVDYDFLRGTRTVNWGTIANLTFKPTASQKISLRTTVNVNTEDESREFEGLNREDINEVIRSDRIRFLRRLMLWSQLSGEHQMFGDARFDWRVTGARADRSEPFMREAIYSEDDGEFFLDRVGDARYFFSELTDDDLNGEADFRYPFDFLGNEAAVQVGGAYRNRTRDFAARRLDWQFVGNTIRDLDEALETAEIVPRGPGVGELALNDRVQPGDIYGADDIRIAGYLMLELPVTDRLQAIVGARVEDYDLELRSRSETSGELEVQAEQSQTDLVPSLNLIFDARDDMKIRGAVSRTVDRPEFRELAPFQFTEAASLRELVGNPQLETAEVTSGDLRVDWFPGPGEIISLGGFYKKIQDPIEQVFIAAASSAYSYQNGDEADVIGIEFDAQLQLARLSDALRDFSFQGNYSWIDSEVTVREGGGFDPTNLIRPLQGQASYVFNAGVSWIRTDVEAGFFYNRFGERLTAAGGSGVPDIYEQPRNSLDASVSFPLPTGARAEIKGSNLLDDEYLWRQSANGITLVQRQYTVGRTFSVGLSWEF
jgi:hypothetical protein